DPTFVEGVVGMAMEFDGDDHVDTGNTEDLAVWTIACWAKSPAAPSGDSPSGPVHREQNYQFNWNHSNETFRGSVTVSAGGWHAASLGTLEADTWYHLAGTYDGEDLKAYKDGVLITTNDAPSGPPAAEAGTLKLGRHATAVQYFTGTVDEAIVYSRALSAGEVRYLAGFRPMVDPGTDGLAAAYVFEADAADSSGNGLDGTLLGDAHVADGVLVLDGEDDAVAIPGIGDGLTEFTFSMMVYPTVDVVPLQFSGGINTDDWGGGVHLKLNYGTVNVGVEGLAGGDVVGTTIAQPDTWTHLALTVSPDEVAVYVNGVKEGSRIGEAVPAVNVGAATIGAWNNGGTDVQREMTGMMDNVLIYNRALSEAEVLYLANN
ncbi:MAG TPA: LamG domain-containing protein, partial [Sedimentisphaerales bacterium]|nr:LamG domain-containing protein [Sedimentisphaerales bacterium]